MKPESDGDRRHGAFSKIGARQANEDSYAFWRADDTFFAAVADGLGGMDGGGHASSFVVDYVKTHATRPDIGSAELVDLVRECHRGLHALQQQSIEDRSMATTLVVIVTRAGGHGLLHALQLTLHHSGAR